MMAKLKSSNPYDEKFFDTPSRPPPTPARASASTTVRLNLDLHASLHRQLRQLALDEDTTAAAIVRDLIEERVARGHTDPLGEDASGISAPDRSSEDETPAQ